MGQDRTPAIGSLFQIGRRRSRLLAVHVWREDWRWRKSDELALSLGSQPASELRLSMHDDGLFRSVSCMADDGLTLLSPFCHIGSLAQTKKQLLHRQLI